MSSFFEHQRLARRNTRVMVILFLLAVVAVVLAVDLALAAAWIHTHTRPGGIDLPWSAMWRHVPSNLYLGGAMVTAGAIFVVSIVNVTRLGGGGAAVAEMVGARAVPAGTQDPLERRLRNVVEEMAIAAGVRVPAVYVMDEERGINAFAAGWEVSGAVVAVTRGTLETLTRDELQGVIGHEFSHILNGDMRLNIRMMGVLAGIVFVSSVGRFLMRGVRGSRRSGGQLALLGLGLFIIGFVGLFFARLIKAAVSRQREFLADASSVQFTRNPDGLAGALDQIRSASAGTLIQNRYAEEMSHMFFGQSVRMFFAGLFDTHPPLEERIRRVRPGFQPSRYRQGRPAASPAPGGDPATPAAEGALGFAGAASVGRRAEDAASAWGRSAGESAGLVGTVAPQDIDYAARLLDSLPGALRDALRDPCGAAAATIALLLAPAGEVMAQQLAALEAAGLAVLGGRAQSAHAHTRGLGAAYRLPLIDLALPALRAASAQEQEELLRGLEAVIHADRRVSLAEFAALTLVRSQLGEPQRSHAGSQSISRLQGEVLIVLSLVALSGHGAAQAQAAFSAGARHLGLAQAPLVPAAQLSMQAAGEALEKLRALAPLAKRELIGALFAAATFDGNVRLAEAELLRVAGAVLDCPLPPLLQ